MTKKHTLQLQTTQGKAEKRPVRTATAEEAAAMLEASSSVIIVPGYGLAVA
jgi:NAD(P) transhydrogenase subunit beta